MAKNSITRDNSGFSRILEAVIAAVILFIVFSVATFLIQTSDVKTVQERADLDRTGYNVLTSLVESGAIEKIETSSTLDVKNYLRTIIQSSLPPTVYFSFSISNCTEKGPYVAMQLVEGSDVTNCPSELFANSAEVSSTDLVYTSKSGNVYGIVFLLTRAGAGS
jgi:hypothetical protein